MDILLNTTKEVLLDIENQILEVGREQLGYSHGCWMHHIKRRALPAERPAHPTILSFLDGLAKSRDDIWRQYRMREKPATTTLPSLYPRGLPLITLLQPFNKVISDIIDLMPGENRHLAYIASRAEDLVFIPANVALSTFPENEEVVDAIFPLLDSWSLALRVYVMGQNLDTRLEAIRRTWKHATGELTGSRMTEEESQQQWGSIFRDALGTIVEEVINVRQIDSPSFRLPEYDDPSVQVEWDPLHACRPYVEDRPLSVKAIDWSTQPSLKTLDYDSSSWYIESLPSRAEPPEALLRGYQPPPIWETVQNTQWTPGKEADVASAILYLDAQFRSSKRLLTEQFPSCSDCRYPAMFLDEGFLLRKDVSDQAALNVIATSIKLVPPTMLESLTKNALEALQSTHLDSPKLVDVERNAFMLLKLLMKSDRPTLAVPLAIKTILDRPDASSWHRQLLASRFLRRLSSEEARKSVEHLASKISSTLREQGLYSNGKRNEPTLRPFVKVTTVKLLAQLLEDSNVISRSLVEILSKLVRGTEHIDIRVATLKSLLEILYQCEDEDSRLLAEKIMELLESLRDVAGAFNERNPMTEDEWKEAENKQNLPEPFPSAEWPPVMMQFLSAPLCLGSGNVVKPQDFFQRIILPAINRSRQSNERWMRLFCRIHDTENVMDHLPITPVDCNFVHMLFTNHLQYLPASWATLLHELFMFSLSPPSAVQTINHKLESDRVLGDGPDYHWHRHYGQLPSFNSVQLLTKEFPLESSNGITLATVQAFAFEEAKALLAKPSLTLDAWYNFIEHLTYKQSAWANKQRWTKQARPVLEKIISHIEAIRTSQWQQDTRRQPPVLPSTYSLHLSFLVLPSIASERGSAQERYDQFVQQLRDFIRTHVIGMDATPYHTGFKELTLHIQESLDGLGYDQHNQFASQVASSLDCSANLANVKLEDYLCIELANTLLETATDWLKQQTGGLDALVKMIIAWEECEDEHIRAFGEKWVHQSGMSWLRAVKDSTLDPRFAFIPVTWGSGRGRSEWIALTRRGRRVEGKEEMS